MPHRHKVMPRVEASFALWNSEFPEEYVKLQSKFVKLFLPTEKSVAVVSLLPKCRNVLK